MITCYFGVPGVGKTSTLARIAVLENRRIKQNRSNYKRVFTNFECAGCYKITFQDLDKYLVEDSLILLDELMLDADNRGFKTFPLGVRDFLTLHRHAGVDIIYATQAYDKVDTKIRALTQDLWYMTRSVVPFLRQFTVSKRIYRNIAISEYNGELIMGYRFCNFIEKLFVRNILIVYRKPYYKYFDSFELGVLGERKLLPLDMWEFQPKKTNLDLSKLKFVIATADVLASAKREKDSRRF